MSEMRVRSPCTRRVVCNTIASYGAFVTVDVGNDRQHHHHHSYYERWLHRPFILTNPLPPSRMLSFSVCLSVSRFLVLFALSCARPGPVSPSPRVSPLPKFVLFFSHSLSLSFALSLFLYRSTLSQMLSPLSLFLLPVTASTGG